jgi:hypothetical protein
MESRGVGTDSRGASIQRLSNCGGAIMAMRLRPRLVMAALALALAAAPALPEAAQQGTGARKPGRAPVGLPVYTSDGKAIGKVIATGVDEDDQPVLVAEIERSLGFGPEAIAIPTELFMAKSGRIELTLTEAEVNARLGR